MQLTGLEPEPTYVDMNLNHARMPIPPQLHAVNPATRIVYHIILKSAIEKIKNFKKICGQCGLYLDFQRNCDKIKRNLESFREYIQ